MTGAFPFAGIYLDRPYPPTGLTTARWAAEVPTAEVAFGALWLTQGHVYTTALFGVAETVRDPLPHVVAYGGLLLLEDGHNRVVRTALGGALKMRMRVFQHPGTAHGRDGER